MIRGLDGVIDGKYIMSGGSCDELYGVVVTLKQTGYDGKMCITVGSARWCEGICSQEEGGKSLGHPSWRYRRDAPQKWSNRDVFGRVSGRWTSAAWVSRSGAVVCKSETGGWYWA